MECATLRHGTLGEARQESVPDASGLLDGTFDGECVVSGSQINDKHPGCFQGGALVLAFAARADGPPSQDTVSLLSGVIASSPFILRATPTPRHVRLIGWLLSFVLPNLVLHTPINPNVRSHIRCAC